MPSPENRLPKPAEDDFRRGDGIYETVTELYDLPIDLTDAELDPETFKQTLVSKHDRLIEDMHRQHEENMEALPGYDDSVLPGSLVAVLSRHAGKKWKNVIERDAYWSNSTGGTFFEMRELLPKYHPYWLAVAESGFIPEVRMVGVWGGHGTAELYARLNRPSFSTDD